MSIYHYKYPELPVWEVDAEDIKSAEKKFINRWIYAVQAGHLDNIEGSFSEGLIECQKNQTEHAQKKTVAMKL